MGLKNLTRQVVFHIRKQDRLGVSQMSVAWANGDCVREGRDTLDSLFQSTELLLWVRICSTKHIMIAVVKGLETESEYCRVQVGTAIKTEMMSQTPVSDALPEWACAGGPGAVLPLAFPLRPPSSVLRPCQQIGSRQPGVIATPTSNRPVSIDLSFFYAFTSLVYHRPLLRCHGLH